MRENNYLLETKFKDYHTYLSIPGLRLVVGVSWVRLQTVQLKQKARSRTSTFRLDKYLFRPDINPAIPSKVANHLAIALIVA